MALASSVRHLWVYSSPFLIFGGTVSNVLCLFVLSTRGLRTYSFSFYLRFLALTDITSLYAGLMRFWIRELTNDNVDIRKLSNFSCKAQQFFLYWSSHTSSWLLVMFSIDRAIAVCLPMRHKVLFHEYRTRIGVIIIAVVIAAVNGHFFWTSGALTIKYEDGETAFYPCTYMDQFQFFRKKVWPWMDLVLLSIIPAVVIIVCNSLIFYSNASREVNMMSAIKKKTMTLTLIVVSITFLVTTAPLTIFNIVDKLTEDLTPYQEELFNLIYAITTQLYYLNCCLNFWLYCASGSKVRREFQRIFCRNRAVHPISSGTNQQNALNSQNVNNMNAGSQGVGQSEQVANGTLSHNVSQSNVQSIAIRPNNVVFPQIVGEGHF